MEKGSKGRRAILAGLGKVSDYDYSLVDFGRSEDMQKHNMGWARKAFDRIPGFKQEYSRYAVSGVLSDDSILPSWAHGNRVVITAYIGNENVGVSVSSMHGYGEARKELGAHDSNLKTFKYVKDPDGRVRTVPVDDPVQVIYEGAQEALKKFRKLQVTPLDPLKWQRFKRMDYRDWARIKGRSEVVEELGNYPESFTRWYWDKKEGYVWSHVFDQNEAFQSHVIRRSPNAFKSLSDAKDAAKEHKRSGGYR